MLTNWWRVVSYIEKEILEMTLSLPYLSKILQTVVWKRLDNFLSSTITLLRVREVSSLDMLHLLESMESITTTIDLRTYIDTIDHCLLLQNLERYGFRINVHKWLSSNFSNRKQCEGKLAVSKLPLNVSNTIVCYFPISVLKLIWILL